MEHEYELDRADFITVGTIGPPGQRVFHLQAREDDTLITLIIEKVQASAIADSIESVLEQIEEEYDLTTPEVDLDTLDLDLLEPILPIFRVGQIGIGYSGEDDRLYLVVSELLPEEAVNSPRTIRIAGTRNQMRALADHARQVVSQGRPICGNCGEPMDPEGHFCPKSNGHRKPTPWA